MFTCTSKTMKKDFNNKMELSLHGGLSKSEQRIRPQRNPFCASTAIKLPIVDAR